MQDHGARGGDDHGVHMRSETAILTLAAALFAGGVVESANATASRGLASFYGYHAKTANGEMMNPQAMTAAHPSLPFGTHVRVTDVNTHRAVVVRINDRGPFVKGRIIDISTAAAHALGIVDRGVAMVEVEVVS
jgi:rare lipoprotein A